MEQVIFDLEKQEAESIYGGGEQILYVSKRLRDSI